MRLCPILILGLGLAPVQASADPAVADPVTITAENVELYGAGPFEFQPDDAAFSVAAPAGGNGVFFSARLWLDAAGQPVQCDAGETALVDAARIACTQLMRSARFKLRPGMNLSYRRGFVDVAFNFFSDPPDRPAGRTVFAFPQPGYSNVVVNYPPEQAFETALLDPAAGTFAIPVSPDDYPPVAMRQGSESASTVMLGIDRTGTVKTCRPFGTSARRTSFLDNHSCALMLDRARFHFLANAAQFEGLRYVQKRLMWRLPR